MYLIVWEMNSNGLNLNALSTVDWLTNILALEIISCIDCKAKRDVGNAWDVLCCVARKVNGRVSQK